MKHMYYRRNIIISLVILVIVVFASSPVHAREDYLRPAVGEVVTASAGAEWASVTSDGGVTLNAASGEMLTGWPLFIDNSAVVSSPLLLDMTGDEASEVAVVARDSNDKYSLYVYDGAKQLLASTAFNAPVYYDPAAWKEPGAVKSAVAVTDINGAVVRYSLSGGQLNGAPMIGKTEPIAVSFSAGGQEMAVAYPGQPKLEIYLWTGGNWKLDSAINLSSPVIYPVLFNAGMLYGVTADKNLVGFDKTLGTMLNGFPVALSAMPVESPLSADVDTGVSGAELVVALANGERVAFKLDGTKLSNLASASFVDNGGASGGSAGLVAAVRDFAVGVYKKIENKVMSLFSTIRFALGENNANEFIYEDAEDGTTNGWGLYAPNQPAGSITNVNDDQTHGRAIEIALEPGYGQMYKLGKDDGSAWANDQAVTISWEQKTAAKFAAYVQVDTTVGTRYLMYSPDYEAGNFGGFLGFNLSTALKDGAWHTVTRNLQTDLAVYVPGATITRVNFFLYAGTGRLDNIKLLTNASIFQVSGTVKDQGGTGVPNVIMKLSPGNTFVATDANGAYQFTGLANGNYTITPQNDSFGFQPASASANINNASVSGVDFTAQSNGVVVYEDAEDGTTNGWSLYNPNAFSGALLNVADDQAHGKAIQIDLDAGYGQMYKLHKDDGTPWANTEGRHLSWDMKTADKTAKFAIYVDVDTNFGARTLMYSPDYEAGNFGGTYAFNLPANLKDTAWHTITRDLQADVNSMVSGHTITKVNRFLFSGHSRLDNIKLANANAAYSVSGVITSLGPQPVANITVQLLPTTLTTLTDAQGRYTFLGVANGDYTIAPQSPSYAFNPQTISVTVNNGSVANKDFVATATDTFIYEDAEYGTVNGWDGLYNANMPGGNVTNVVEDQAHGKAIQIELDAGYGQMRMLGKDDNTAWANESAKVLSWDMKVLNNQKFAVYVKADTSIGERYLMYSADFGAGNFGGFLAYDVPQNLKDGAWHTVSRDLQADLQAYYPGATVTRVNFFLFAGHARLDNIKLTKNIVIAPAGALTVQVDSGTPGANNYVMGNNDVTIAKFKFSPDPVEAINITQLVVSAKFASGATNTLSNIRLIDDVTGAQVGPSVASFSYIVAGQNAATGTYSHATFSGLNLQIPKNTPKTLALKVDFTTYEAGSFTTTGQTVTPVILKSYYDSGDNPVTAVGAASGTNIVAAISTDGSLQTIPEAAGAYAATLSLYRAKLVTAWASDSPSGDSSPAQAQTIAKVVISNLANAGAYIATVNSLNLDLSSTFTNTAPRFLNIYKDSLSTTALAVVKAVDAGQKFSDTTIADTDFTDVDIAAGASKTFYATLDTSDASSTKALSVRVGAGDVLWSDGVTAGLTVMSDNLPFATYKNFTY